MERQIFSEFTDMRITSSLIVDKLRQLRKKSVLRKNCEKKRDKRFTNEPDCSRLRRGILTS
jgi:hypothetical protein